LSLSDKLQQNSAVSTASSSTTSTLVPINSGSRQAAAAAAAAAAGLCLYAGSLLHHLTALTLTACDGMCGSTIPLLRGLRHLRLSFCASVTRQAVQQVMLSCNRLVLLELPSELQQQLATAPYSRIHTSGGFAVQFGGSGAFRSAASNCLSSGGGGSRGQSGGHSSSRNAAAVAAADVARRQGPAGLPQQGPGGHLHGLKVVCS
jgi:hypothetical protein